MDVLKNKKMNIVDIFIIVAVLITTIIGITRGFIKELSSITAWVLAGVATFWDIPILRTFMRSKFSSVLVSDVLTGVSAFVIAFVIVSLIGTICAGMIRGTVISSIDRSFGSILGAAKGVLLISCIEIISGSFISREEMPDQVKQSFFANYYIYKVSDFVYELLPAQITSYLDDIKAKNSMFSSQYKEEKRDSIVSDEDLENLGTLKTKKIENNNESYTRQQIDKLNSVLLNGNSGAI